MTKLSFLSFVIVAVFGENDNDVTTNKARGYATFFTGMKCQLKTFGGAQSFFLKHVQDYPDILVAEVAGIPRIKIYKTEQDRDNSVVDSSKLSVEQLTAMLQNGVSKAEVVAILDLSLMSLADIHAELNKYHVFRTFPKVEL